MMLAQRKGVEVWLKTEGLGYTPHTKEGYCTVEVRRFNKRMELKAKVLVGADGLQSQVGRWAGMRTQIKLPELASCLQYIVDNVSTHGLLEIITGHEWAPGGYAWVFPKQDGLAEIGLGVTRNLTEKTAEQHLAHFIEHSFFKDRFKHCRILEIQGGGVPLAAPLKKQYADNMILVGDAARHVNPITGGGIHTALNAGKVAAHFLSELIKNQIPPSEQNLAGYQEEWMKNGGEKMWKLYGEKSRIFDIDDLSQRNDQLYKTMSSYFSPDSEYKKI
jgi:digeranylgeranylglycerophospholipid reductase